MKYTLSTQTFEKKNIASLGKDVINTTVKDETGKVTEKVSIWADFPDFANLVGGSTIDADLVTNAKGYNTLYPIKTYSNTGRGPSGAAMAAKAKTIEKAMDRKEEGITKFQDNKEHSIMVASTATQATQILTSKLQTDPALFGTWKEEWLKIRYWLVNNYSNTEQPKVGETGLDYPQDVSDTEIPF